MKNYDFIFLRLSFYLVLGILASFFLPLKKDYLVIFDLLFFLGFLIAFFNTRKKLFPGQLNGLVFFSSIFLLGFNSGYFANPINQDKHLINTSADITSGSLLEGRILEELKPNSFNNRFIFEVSRVLPEDKKPIGVRGKLLLNIKKDSHKESYEPGNRLLIPFEVQEIESPKNPFQFDYKAYMSNLKVEKQINLSPSEIIIIRDFENSLLSIANSLREKMISKLKENQFSSDEFAVFQALILGQRRDLSDELINKYAAAGAIHILAISGLHIGIILLLLNFLLKPLETFKHGKFLKSLALIFLLWAFAMITGFSPSVVRAVTMFSFLAVGIQLKRKTSTLNSLFLSFFFLVLINPYYLFQVGFQLSYLAVLGIILLHPLIGNLFNPKNKFIKYFHQLISVSIAAQVSILPLSLYYFHQFPGLFLVSNLIILPLLGIIVIGGILIIFMATAGILPAFISNFFEFLLNLLNLIVEEIAGYEEFIFKDIPFSLLHLFVSYLILICILICLNKITFRKISILLTSIIFFQISHIYEYYQVPTYEGIIFHGRTNAIGIKSRNELKILNNLPSKNILADYMRERRIENLLEDSLNLIHLQDLKILVVDSSSIYDIKGLQPDIILLNNSPKINLERLIAVTKPSYIVANGTNYPSYIKAWKLTCGNKKIPFHYTGEKGAYIFNSLSSNSKKFL